jgi:hypothetical protein
MYLTLLGRTAHLQECTVKTFREQLPTFISVRQQWTNRCEDFIISLSLNMNCETASRICKQIGVKVSADTIIRIMIRNTREIPFTGESIGIDDWPYKKGHSYGTLICDGVTAVQ